MDGNGGSAGDGAGVIIFQKFQAVTHGLEIERCAAGEKFMGAGNGFGDSAMLQHDAAGFDLEQKEAEPVARGVAKVLQHSRTVFQRMFDETGGENNAFDVEGR